MVNMDTLINNDVYSRLIYRFLMQSGKVAIPGMGTFVLVRKASEFKADHTRLQPPQTSIEFLYEEDPGFYLADLLAEDGYSKEESDKIVKSIVFDYQNAISEKKPFRLFVFGALLNKVVLEDRSGTFNKYYGLREVSMSPVPVRKILTTPDDTLNGLDSPLFNSKEQGSMSYFWPLLVAFLTILVLLLRLVGEKKTTPPVTESWEIIDTLGMDTDTNISADTILPAQTLDTIATAQLPADVTPEPQSTKPSVSENQPCVLVAGAFARESNARNMVRKLKRKGYKPYEQKSNGLHRVGIIFDCQLSDPDAFKARAERDMKQQMWYLKDTI